MLSARSMSSLPKVRRVSKIMYGSKSMSSFLPTNVDIVFYTQLAISISALIFTGTMAVVRPDQSNIYIPIFTSIVFAFIPSPATVSQTNATLNKLSKQVTQLQLKDASLETETGSGSHK